MEEHAKSGEEENEKQTRTVGMKWRREEETEGGEMRATETDTESDSLQEMEENKSEEEIEEWENDSEEEHRYDPELNDRRIKKTEGMKYCKSLDVRTRP